MDEALNIGDDRGTEKVCRAREDNLMETLKMRPARHYQ